jgi:hypothetical protein
MSDIKRKKKVVNNFNTNYPISTKKEKSEQELRVIPKRKQREIRILKEFSPTFKEIYYG